jgi:hypothetical protein
VAERPRPLGVAADYARLGVRHLAGGLDHVLFLLGLLTLVDGLRALVATVTAFTAGHAVTLGLATLGAVTLPPRPVEVGIAASLVLLALAAARRGGGESAAWSDRPARLALGFGLLHGLGFAGALAEAGLPREALGVALVAFHAGVEAAQLGLVAAVLLLAAALRRLRPAADSTLFDRPVTLYAHAIGAAGVYLCLDRLLP